MFLLLVLAAVPGNQIQNFVSLLPRTVAAAKKVMVKELTCFASM